MQNKTVLITGSNSGIGKHTAIGLAKKSAQIIMICRSQERGEAARQEIIKESGNDNIILELCDLSSMEDIRKVGQRLRATYSHLDILINNAGAIFGHHQLTKEGLERTFALNHMGYFLLTHYLLDLVKKGSDKRIVNVASMAHSFVRRVPWDDLQLQNSKYKQMHAYGLSKLYSIYFTQALAQKMEKDQTGITVNCLHPGTVYTGFGASGTNFFAKLVKIGGPLLATPQNGAKTSIYLASSPEVADINGQYFAHRKKAKITRLARREENKQKLWDISMALAEVQEYGLV